MEVIMFHAHDYTLNPKSFGSRFKANVRGLGKSSHPPSSAWSCTYIAGALQTQRLLLSTVLWRSFYTSLHCADVASPWHCAGRVVFVSLIHCDWPFVRQKSLWHVNRCRLLLSLGYEVLAAVEIDRERCDQHPTHLVLHLRFGCTIFSTVGNWWVDFSTQSWQALLKSSLSWKPIGTIALWCSIVPICNM